MAESEVIQDVYSISLDEAALARLKSGLASGRKAVADWTAQVKAQPVVFDGAAKAMENYAKSVEQSNAKITASQKKANDEAKKQASAGSAQKLFSTGAQLAGALGGGGVVGQAISTAGGVTDTIRELPKLTDAVKELKPQAIATGAGVAALTVALALYNQEQARTKAAALSEIDSRQKALTLLQTGSQQEIQTRINQLAQQKAINEKTAADANQLFQNLKDETLKNLGPAAAAAEYYAASVGMAAGPYQAAKEAADKANASLGSTSTELEILEKQSGLTAQSVTDVAKALQNAQYISGDISNRAAADLEAYQLANNGTQKQLDERVRSLQLESAVLSNNIDAANAQADALGRNTAEGQAAAQQASELTKRYNAVGTTLNFLQQEFVRTAVAARDAAEFTRQQNDEKVAATKAFNEAEKKAIADNNKEKADALDRLNEAQVKAADEAADAAEKALQSLIDKKAQLSQGLADAFTDDEVKRKREEFDAQIKIQQEEAKAARDHARALVKIQKDGMKDEQAAIDARDFARLFEIRDQRKEQIDEENDTYIESRKQANEAAAQEAQDRTRNYAREREDRLTNYNRALREAQAQYTRETQQADANKRQQLQLAQQAYTATLSQLQTKLTTEQRLNQSAYDAALKQANTSATQRIEIEQKVTDAFLAQANKRLAAISNGGGVSGARGGGTGSGRFTATRAGGGTLNAFQGSSYNELAGQREKWNGYQLPDGSGFIFPLRSGYMDSGGGGRGGMTFNAPLVQLDVQTGGTTAQINGLGDMVAAKVLDVLQVVTKAKVSATPI